MSAAMEASLEGIMSLGVSLLDYSQNADFSASKIVLEKILQKLMVSNGRKPYLLNVNIPNVPIEQIRGIRTCRQAQGNWEEEFMESKDPRNQTYYWLTGKFVNYDKEEDTDLWALENNFVSIVPSHHDLTNYSALSALSYFDEVDVHK